MEKYKTFDDYREKLKKDLSIRVIYTDLDGTLLNDKGCLVKDADENFFYDGALLLERFEKKGWDLVLVSGRNKLQLRYNAMLMGLKNYIPELGCEVVYDLGKKVYTTFDKDKYHYEVTRGGRDLVKIIDILKREFPQKIESKLEWSMERSYNALFFGDIDLEKANKLLRDNGYEGLSLVDNGFSNLLSVDLDVEHLRIYNLIPKGVNKAVAIKLDRRLRNLDKKDCIALGDSPEDLKMAEEVGAFFLMPDAVNRDSLDIKESLKKYDNVYIVGQRMNRGWTEVMKYFLE